MERKIYALMLLIMAWANKYIKSKIGEISGVIRNFMEEAGVILSMSFRLLVVVSCLFFSVAEVEAQLCSGGVRFEKPGCLENPVVDKGIFQIYPGRPDQTQPGCNSNLGELSGHQYYVSDGIYSQFGDVENAKLPSDDDSKSYLLYKPSNTNSILTVRVHKLPGNPTNQVFVSFRFFYGNVKGDPASPVTGTYIKTNSSNGNYDFYITKDDCPEQVHQVSSGSSGGLDLGTSFCGDKYGWYTMRALITLPEYLDNNFLDIWLEMNFYNQPAGDVIFLDNVLVSYNGTICVEKSMACPGDVLSLTDEVYPYGTAISWQYRYPDNSDQWFDVADPSAGFTFNPDGDFDKQNLQFRAEVTLLDGSKSMTDILEVTMDPKCKPQVSVSPSGACAGDEVNLKTKYYPANSEITWEYRYPGSSDWATIPSGSFISSSGGETSTPFTYNPPQGVSSAEFRAKAKLQDGTEIPVSNVVVVKTTTTCPIEICEIDEIVITESGLYNWAYYDLNGNRLSVNCDLNSTSCWNGSENVVVKEVLYEHIMNNGGVEIKAQTWNQNFTFTFKKGKNCESLEILGDEPITICEGETPTVTYQLKGAAGTYNYVAKLYDKNNVEVNAISGTWTTTADPADVSLNLPGNISFGEYSLKLSVNDQEFDAVTRTVTVKQPIAFELSPVSPICKGESVSLSVVGDVAGDVATTDAYQWYKDDVAIAGATTTSYEATPDASAVYKLEVKGNVCPAVSETISVEVKENPQVTVTTSPICAGTSDAPIATMTPSDGMTFEWVNAPTWSSLTAGTHTVSYKITSDNGCSVVGTTDVTVEAPIVFELAKAGPICKGESVDLQVEGNVIGVVANTDAYQWYEGGVAIPGATGATYTASPESTTEYSLTIKGNKCEATTKSVKVEVEEPIDFTLAEVDAICEGESVELKVDGAVIGTLAENNAYQWYKGSEKIEGATSPSYELQNATVTATADYTLTVSGKKCKSVSKTVSVVVKELPDADLTAEPICQGLTVAPKVPGNWISGWNYGWINEPAWETLSVGVHKQKYVVTAPNGCSAEGEMDVTVEAPIVFELAKSGPICKGESVDLKVEGTVSGFVANTDAYQWYEGGVAIPGATGVTYTASPESTTEYSLTIKGNKCEATTKSVKVEVEEPIDFTLAEVDAICEGESVELKVDGAVIGTLAENNAYQWYKGSEKIEGATSPSYELQNATVTATADYTLTVSGKKCKSVSKTVSVVVKELPDADLTAEPICQGLTVAPKVPGNWISGWNYGWINEPAWETLSVGVHKQKYVVTAPNGCFAEGEMDVTVEEPIQITMPKVETLCVGAFVELTPISVTGTLANNPYSWKGGGQTGVEKTFRVEKLCETITCILTVKGNACPEKSEKVQVPVVRPELKEPWPANKEDQEVCFSDGDFSPIKSEAEIKALYGPDCNTVKVTFTDDKEEDDCGWYKKRTYVVTDACQHDVSPVNPVIKVSGGDKEKPTAAQTEITSTIDGCKVGDSESVTTITALESIFGEIKDNCSADSDLKISSTESSTGSCPIVITRIYTVTDACENPLTLTHTIKVDDSTAPEIAGSLAPITVVGCDATAAPTAYTTIAKLVGAGLTVSDNCSADFTISSEDVETSSNCSIVVTRTYTIADACGNTATAKQTITIKRDDFKMPENGAATVQCASEAKAAGEAGSKIVLPDVEDACGNKLTGVLKEGYPTTPPTCEGTVTYVYTFTDCAGHAHDWEFVYKIEKPTMTFSGSIVDVEGVDACYTEEQKNKLLTADAVKAMYTSSCNREITVTPTDEIESNSDCGWKITRTYTISDGGCNTDTKTMSVSGSDKTVPELIGTWPKDIVDQDNCVANADITGLMSDNDVKALYKDCSSFEVSHADATTGDDCGWTVTRTYTIKDKCNNATTKTMSVSGSDKTAPELTGTRPEDISGQNTCFANADLSGLKDVDYIKGIYSDVCGDVNVTYSEEKNETDCGWSVKRTYLISDFCKNSVSTSVTVSGKDAEKPVITTTAVSGDKGCNPTIVAPTFTVTDNCDNNVQVQVTTTGVQGAGYKKTQTWTATAKDVCGNSAEPVVIVYTWIEDSSTPFAVQMPADMVICQGSSVKLIPTIQGDPTSFSWKQGGTEVSTDETYTATPNETTTYHFTAVANECISSSGSVTITVEDPISFDLNEKDLVICEGTSVSLEPINIQGDLAQAPYSWTKNGVVVSSAAKLIDTPSANATYELTISGNKCAKARKSVSVTAEKQPSVHLRLSDNEVCEDENVTLQVTYSNVLGLEWLSKEEGNSEFTVFANNLSATNEVVATNDIMYQVRSTGNQVCPEAVSNAVALTVEPKMEISLPSEIAICSKDEKTIEAAFSRTPTSIVWMVKNANAANYHQTKFTEAKIVVNPNVSSYYKVIASSKNCPTAEAEVLLKVEEIPNWEIISQTNNVCEGDEVELSTDLPSDYNFVWEAKTHGSANYERLPESTSKLYDSPMESTTYRLTVQSSAGCSAGSKLYDVKVDKPVYGSIADIAICDGDSGRLSVFVDDKSSYSYYWSDMPDYSNVLSRQTSVRVAPKTTTSYYLKIVNGVCTTEYEAEVEVRTLPEIVGIEDMGNRMYRIQVEGGSVPYSYTWGKNSMPTSSDIMERPTYGMTYNVTVTDAIGCKVSDVVEVPTYELEIPEYFFPEIEKWKVKNLDRFYGSKVTIYDRFGKMLKEYDVDQFKGWDGTYLGSPMPSTDYWYVISIQELDKELVGHFTLRRRNK